MNRRTGSADGLSAEQRRRLLAEILRKKAARPKSYPVSFAQQRLWLLDRLAPGSPAYNIPMAIRLTGRLDVEALRRGLDEVVARHQTLRTAISSQGDDPVQLIYPPSRQELPVVDLSDLDEDERQREALARASAEAWRPFALDQSPLFRTTLIKLADEEHVLVGVMHHIISDGWSLAVMFREFALLYPAFTEGRESPLPELPIQYVDYTLWQREQLQGEGLDKALRYWLDRLKGLSPLELPTDRPRPARPRYMGGSRLVTLPASLTADLEELGRRNGASLFMTLLAAFKVLLFRYSGQEDVSIGSPVACRTRPETEGLIGFFANTVVLRTDLSGGISFRELLGRARETTLGALKHQDTPFERLVEAINPERDTSRHPLFQVSFAYQQAPWPKHQLPDLTLTPIEIPMEAAKFDLWLSVRKEAGRLLGTLEYDRGLYDTETAQRMLGHWQSLLESAVADPETPITELRMLADEERQQVVRGFNNTAKDYGPSRCLHQLVEEQAHRTPEAVALVFEGLEMTYRELNEKANQLAHYLRKRGVGAERVVGVYLHRSFEMVVSLLAVLKASGAYTPLDPDYPEQRIAFMLEDADPPVILTTGRLAGALPESAAKIVCLDQEQAEIGAESVDDPVCEATPNTAAYVIFTSGSTGRPKGALNEHRSIVNRLLWMQDRYQLDADDRVLQKTPFSFDVSGWEFWWPLLVGCRLVIARPEGHKDSGYLARLIAREGITTLHFVPSMLRIFLEEDGLERCDSLKRVICSGEALSWDLQQQFFERMTAELHNLYGPTEAAIDVTSWECRADDQRRVVPIGAPIANIQTYILDRQMSPVPIGVPGELYLGGVGVGRGYVNRPELTAERFIPDPFGDEPQGRLYKTGDLCRWMPDGNIDFLGRLDHQVKIRGLRIELDEIQAVLSEYPAVRDAVVVDHQDSGGERRLVGYVAGDDDLSSREDELRAFLKDRLPDYMVPSIFMVLDTLPLSPNGKVDRKALPAPARPVSRAKYVAPNTPVEEELAAIFGEVLDVERIGIHDDFFALGGHSLLATQVVSRINGRLDVALPLRDLFEWTTVEGLADRVLAVREAGTSLSLPPIERADREGHLPLSFSQEALWFLDQLQPGSAAYVIFAPFRISGALDVDALTRSFDELVRRHEILRTTFPMVDGRPTQRVAAAREQSLPLVDLRSLADDQRAAELERRLATESRRPLDLANGPLFKPQLLQLKDNEFVLSIAMHHSIYDGWSLDVLGGELVANYEAIAGRSAIQLPDPPVQFVDYAVWQRGRLTGDYLDQLVDYWREALADVPPLELATDHPRPAVFSAQGATCGCDLPAELTQKIKTLARQEGVTPFMALLAAFEVLLYRYTGQETFAIGSPVAARLRPETERLIGFFTNMVVLRGDVSGDPTFRELLTAVRGTLFDAFDHQELPFELLVEALNPTRDSSRHPLFQVCFVHENTSYDTLELPGLTVEPLMDELQFEKAKFDLEAHFWERASGLNGTWVFSTDLFERDTIERMIEHYLVLLQSVSENPDLRVSELRLFGEPEQQQVLHDWSKTASDYPRDTTIHEVFQRQADQTPEAVALVFEGRELTYRELNQRANQLARRLRDERVGPDVLVSVCAERSIETMIAILGILKAGGAYVPLDPSYPAERLAFMIEDTAAPVLLTQQELVERLPEHAAKVICLDTDWPTIAHQSTDDLEVNVTAENLAYVIYTSGSTGRPKGVAVTHRAVVRLVMNTDYVDLTPGDCVAHVANIAFDAATFEIWGALLCGGRLAIGSQDVALSTREFAEFLRKQEVTTLFLTTALFNQHVAARPDIFASLRQVLFGGESVDVPTVRKLLEHQPPARLLHVYGPTENTTFTTWELVEEVTASARTVPIGRPISNTYVRILDDRMQPVPVGVPGELYVGGDGLAREYLNRPELTAEKFVSDPFSADLSARLYATGDQCRWLADGTIEFFGRLDQQVKIRGFRVELGEIELALTDHPAVAESVVILREDSNQDSRLVAYTVLNSPDATSGEALRGFVKDRLPDYMVPSAFVVLESIPLSPNGKVDRKALPAPSRPVSNAEYVAPKTPLEEQLAAIWAGLLGLERIGIEDDFFLMGGHSLLAVRMVAEISSQLAIDLPVAAVFALPTVAELAGRIESLRRGEEHDALPEVELAHELATALIGKRLEHRGSLVEIQARGDRPPLFCVHGLGGYVNGFVSTARALGEDRPFYGLRAHGLDVSESPDDTISAMARRYAEAIQSVQPSGPYHLSGWSMGGLIAVDIAVQLEEAGERVALLAMLDTHLPGPDGTIGELDESAVVGWVAPHLSLAIDQLQDISTDAQWELITDRAARLTGLGADEIQRIVAVSRAHFAALRHWAPKPYGGKTVLLRASDTFKAAESENSALNAQFTRLTIERVPGNHYSMLRDPNAGVLAERLNRHLLIFR